jgi:hemolysin III
MIDIANRWPMSLALSKTVLSRLEGEECANMLVHAFGLIFAVLGALLLARLATSSRQIWAGLALSGPMVALFAASALHHGTRSPRTKRLFLALDHGAVMLLISGSYSAFALLALGSAERAWLLTGVWLAASTGLLLAAFAFATGRDRLFELLSPPFDLALGWLPLLGFASSFAAGLQGWPLGLVVGGGVAYSAGVVIYLSRRPWSHAIWHAAVVAGCTCHVAAIALLLG